MLSHSGLWAALKGGPGNFGIVTRSNMYTVGSSTTARMRARVAARASAGQWRVAVRDGDAGQVHGAGQPQPQPNAVDGRFADVQVENPERYHVPRIYGLVIGHGSNIAKRVVRFYACLRGWLASKMSSMNRDPLM
jgi:hypothetical protein